MKNFKQVLFYMFLLLALAASSFYIIKGIQLVFDYLNTLQKETAAAIIAATTTIVVTIVSILLAKFNEKKMQIELEIRDKKIPVYTEFVNFILRILSQDKPGGKKLTEIEIGKFFTEFTEKLLIWGSDEVIKNYIEYRYLLMNLTTDENKQNSLFILEKLLYSIRKDTGHKNKNMNKGDILKLFINDIDKYIMTNKHK